MNRPLTERIAELEKTRLVELLCALALNSSAAAAFLERELPAGKNPTAAPAVLVHATAVARQVTLAIREAYSGRYPSPRSVGAGMEAALVPAELALAQGDARAALAFHAAAWGALADAGEDLWQDECELSDDLDPLGTAFARTLLAANLDDPDSADWAERIEEWQTNLSPNALEGCLDLSLEAAQAGWGSSHIKAALAGELPRGSLIPAAAYDNWGRPSSRMHELRLATLEARGDWESYLNLACACGLVEQEVSALLRLDRKSEALQALREATCDLSTGRKVAELMEGAGERAEALGFADRLLSGAGVDLGGATLARWARDAALAAGEPDRALTYARQALKADPTVADFKHVKQLAADRWPTLRDEVLSDACGASPYARHATIEILLSEGEVQRAIDLLGPHPGHALVELVADAAMGSHPDWVFNASVNEFNRIADRGKSQYYFEAGQWLARARTALRLAGRGEEWSAFIEDMIKRHGRKHSLKPILLKLR